MARRKRAARRSRSWFWAVGGVAVGVLVTVSGTGIWTLWDPAAASSFCSLGLSLQGANPTPAPSPIYDEQAILFDPIAGSSVGATATVSPDTDAQGYGAAFLVNAESETGYWYQVGVAYNWGWGSGYLPGYAFVYSVYAPGTPSGSPTSICLEKAPISGDATIGLSITLQGGTVLVSFSEPGTGTIDAAVFSSYGASGFLGTEQGSHSGFFTGWMTEWRHAEAYYGPSANASYEVAPGQSTAYFGIGEYQPANGQVLFGQTSTQPLDCGCTQSFTYEGVTETATTSTFTTG
jgi:hypothetical protein